MPTKATSLATGLILCATSFSLGSMYTNWAYDYQTLWTSNPPLGAFAASLAHYKTLATMPNFLKHVHHFIMSIGLIGLISKLYRPSESNWLFDGGSVLLYVIGIAFYITNIRTGAIASITGEWGDVDENTGLNVIAATEVFIAIVLIGVIGLQFGQYLAEREDDNIRKKARKAEVAEKKEK